MEIFKEKIDELAQILTNYNLTEIEVSNGEDKIRLRKEADSKSKTTALNRNVSNPLIHTDDNLYNQKLESSFKHIERSKIAQDELELSKLDDSKNENKGMSMSEPMEPNQGKVGISSPIAGIFYRQSNPQNKPYAEIGKHVKKGEILCLVEAMKMINEVPSTCDGIVKKFCFENGQFVEYGATLAIIEEE